jgi:hypothetical protein
MKNKKKQRERLGQTTFERRTEYPKPSMNGAQSANGNGVVKSPDKPSVKRPGKDEDKSPRKKVKTNDSPKTKKTKSNVNGKESSMESSGNADISQLFSDHNRLLPGTQGKAMTDNYRSSTP